MGNHFASGLLAGVTAAVIWASICLMVGIELATTGLWALIFLIAVTIITTIIAGLISKNRPTVRG